MPGCRRREGAGLEEGVAYRGCGTQMKMPVKAGIRSGGKADQEAFFSSVVAFLAFLDDFLAVFFSPLAALASDLAAGADEALAAGVACAKTAAENTVAIRAASSL